MSSIKCPNCGLINFADADACKRCGVAFDQSMANDQSSWYNAADNREDVKAPPSLLKRALVLLAVVAVILFALYASLLVSSEPLTAEQSATVKRAIKVLEDKGFADEASMLNRFTSFRQTDNWWNNYVGHSDAYAATNFPFQVVTLYPDFFTLPVDDTERAAILLHEAEHLYGRGEEKAFANVWRRKWRLGYTKEKYANTNVYRNVREFTEKYAPEVFQCGVGNASDCAD